MWMNVRTIKVPSWAVKTAALASTHLAASTASVPLRIKAFDVRSRSTTVATLQVMICVATEFVSICLARRMVYLDIDAYAMQALASRCPR